MKSQIQQLAGAFVAQLTELQGGDQFARLLNCAEPELRDEVRHLYMEINALIRKLERV